MRHHLAVEHRRHLGDAVQQPGRGIQALQIGHAAVALEHLQRRVVPGVFVERRFARCFVAGLLIGDRAAGCWRSSDLKADSDGSRDHRDQQRTCRPGNARLQRQELFRDRPRDRRSSSFFTMPSASASAWPHRAASMNVGNAHDEIDPWPGRRQRHFQRGDEAGGAVGAVDLLRVVVAQLHHARGLLHGDDARACRHCRARAGRPR